LLILLQTFLVFMYLADTEQALQRRPGLWEESVSQKTQPPEKQNPPAQASCSVFSTIRYDAQQCGSKHTHSPFYFSPP
jgi:hypothetical protein